MHYVQFNNLRLLLLLLLLRFFHILFGWCNRWTAWTAFKFVEVKWHTKKYPTQVTKAFPVCSTYSSNTTCRILQEERMKEKEKSLFSGKENVDSFLFLNVNLSSFLITYIRTQPAVASKPKNVPGTSGVQGPELSPPTISK